MKQFLTMMKEHIPVKEVPKCQHQQRQWHYDFTRHLGEPVVFTVEERKQSPRVCEIYQIYEYHVILQTKAYYTNGKFRCYQYHSVSYNSLHCGDSKVVFINE